MNTAARIESTGRAGFVHLSQDTADELIKFGKSAWIRKRDTKVDAKGLGELQTYWLDIASRSPGSISASSSHLDDTISTDSVGDSDLRDPEVIQLSAPEPGLRTQRLVDWNVQVLKNLLQRIVSASQMFDVCLSPLTLA